MDHHAHWCTIEDPDLVLSPLETARRSLGIDYDVYKVWHEQQEATRSIRQWYEVMSAVITQRPKREAFDEDYYQDCKASNDFFRMYADPVCTYMWAKKAQMYDIVEITGRVIPVGNKAFYNIGMEYVKHGENGGIPIKLEDGSQAYFKPCFGDLYSESKESYRAEMYTFMFDRLLGINRAPPAMLRTVEAAHIRELIQQMPDPDLKHKSEVAFESVMAYCGSTDGKTIEGAVIGWSPFPVKLYQRKELKDRFDVDLDTRPWIPSLYERLTSDTPAVEKRYPLESITGTFFMTMTDNMRKTDHNMNFAQRRVPLEEQFENRPEPDPNDAFADTNDGPLVLLDNDRVKFRGRVRDSLCSNGTSNLIDVCRFPRSIGRRILALGYNASAVNGEAGAPPPAAMPPCTAPLLPELEDYCPAVSATSFGSLLLGLASKAAPDATSANGELFRCKDAYFADMALQYWYNIIARCIALHGEEAVLITEPWVKEYDMMESLKRIHSMQ
eukprot:TRINITY_DN5129_c0_g1_i1.p1 TRINITY_DN5129_c0_g1~~TRINITY_DN5129_c0_g1_i1.p1  ORF type:complete len:576 (-),score=207.95 TRINITY_DN5129_c0_g1_i1:206-1702(-)